VAADGASAVSPNARARRVNKLGAVSEPLLYLHHPSAQLHDPSALSPEHPDSPERTAAVHAAVQAADFLGLERLLAPPATPEQLGLVHSAAQIDSIRRLCESGGGMIDEDTYAGEASYDAALHAAGGACAMVGALAAGRASRGFCALRPAGHHAERDRAMGFCLFNNVAIAAELARRRLGFERVMIVDWDVHHCNGTAEIFRHRDDVLVASIHQSGLFPGTGALADIGSGAGRGYTINVPVPARADEELWVSVLEHVIVPIGLEFRPQLVLISAGYDAHRDDPLGDCRLESSSFGQLACHVRDMALAAGAPIGVVLEGGYDPRALGESVVATLRALAGEGEAESIAPEQLVTPRAASQFGHDWTL
jgi:acetoin utilization deacetylase AcuC-like enzyme